MSVAISGNVDQAFDPNLDNQPTARFFALVRFEPFQVCIFKVVQLLKGEE